MRQQEQMRAQQNQGNNEGGEGGEGGNNANNPPRPSDPMSENAALFASMDPALRSQLLLEATPEVLATLPPEMRA